MSSWRRKIRAGDRGRVFGGADAAGGLDALVDEHLAGIHRYLRTLTRDADLARDLTQETFLKIQSAAPAGTMTSPAAYLYATARNAALSHFRRRKREQDTLCVLPDEDLERAASASPTADPAGDLERTQMRRALREALATLPEALRSVFLLAEIEGLSYADIARVLDCPAGTVASRKHDAVRRLRRELERSGHAL